MPKTLTDHWVTSRALEDIEALASLWRTRALDVLGGGDYFDVTDFVRVVLKKYLREGSTLQIKHWPKHDRERTAKVKFNPLRLFIRADIWTDAWQKQDTFSRYVVAHECGHLILHDHHAQGFSSETGERIGPSDRDRSAEWQADRFADALLAPIEIVERLKSVGEVATRCGVPDFVAERRLREVADPWARYGRPGGLECDSCFSVDTQVIGARKRCRQCGEATRILL